MIGFPVVKTHNFINYLVQRCKNQRDLAFVLETFSNDPRYHAYVWRLHAIKVIFELSKLISFAR